MRLAEEDPADGPVVLVVQDDAEDTDDAEEAVLEVAVVVVVLDELPPPQPARSARTGESASTGRSARTDRRWRTGSGYVDAHQTLQETFLAVLAPGASECRASPIRAQARISPQLAQR